MAAAKAAAKAARKVSRRPAAKAKAAPKAPAPPRSAKEILKAAKPTAVKARKDAPAPVRPKGRQPVLAKELLKRVKPAVPTVERDAAAPPPVHAKNLLKQLDRQQFRFHRAVSTATFEEQAFMEFFGPEIEAELERQATIFNDRFARWPCQCCDVVIRVPRRTEVFHGDYHLVHDDVLGLLVNGERWVPNAETPIEVVQPGRVRNPWTGELVRPGKHAV